MIAYLILLAKKVWINYKRTLHLNQRILHLLNNFTYFCYWSWQAMLIACLWQTMFHKAHCNMSKVMMFQQYCHKNSVRENNKKKHNNDKRNNRQQQQLAIAGYKNKLKVLDTLSWNIYINKIYIVINKWIYFSGNSIHHSELVMYYWTIIYPVIQYICFVLYLG